MTDQDRITLEGVMEFRFTEEQEAFRQKVRDWLKENTPARWAELDIGTWEETDESWAIQLEFERKMAKKRWHAPAFPYKYSGMDADPAEQAILEEERSYNGAPNEVRNFATVDAVGPKVANLAD